MKGVGGGVHVIKSNSNNLAEKANMLRNDGWEVFSESIKSREYLVFLLRDGKVAKGVKISYNINSSSCSMQLNVVTEPTMTDDWERMKQAIERDAQYLE